MIFLLLFVILTLFNAYFSAMEVALVAIRPFRMQQIADQGNDRAKKVLDQLKNPEEYLSAIQVGITLVGIIEGIYGGEAFQRYLEPIFIRWNLPRWMAEASSTLIGIGTITYFTIVLGELLPKTLALRVPQNTALKLIPSFQVFTKIAFPFVRLLTWSTDKLLELFNVKSAENTKLTDADLKTLLGLAYRQGTIEKKEWSLHENIFTFYDQTVSHIMTPLNKVVLVKESMRKEEVDSLLRNTSHIYFPVVRDNNAVVGVLNAKEFFMDPSPSFTSLVRPTCKLHINQRASEVLVKFQEKLVNFGTVVNERDELIGIVTMHNLGESLLGKFA